MTRTQTGMKMFDVLYKLAGSGLQCFKLPFAAYSFLYHFNGQRLPRDECVLLVCVAVGVGGVGGL